MRDRIVRQRAWRFERLGCIALAASMVAASTPVSAQQARKPATPPSEKAVQRGMSSGPSKAGAPFDFKISGAKSATVTGNDAGFCVSPGPLKNSQIFALSMVEVKWAISISAMRPRPPVGKHALSGDMMEGIMADLIDKTTGSEPQQWVHRTVESGTLTVTTSTADKLAGTFEMLTRTEAGADLRANGKFEAKPVKC